MAHVEVGVEIMTPPAKPKVEVLLATYYSERSSFDRAAIAWQTPHVGRLSQGGVPSRSKPWEQSKAPAHHEVREALSVGEADFEFRHDAEDAFCVVLCAKSLGIAAASLQGLSSNPIACGVKIRPVPPHRS